MTLAAFATSTHILLGSSPHPNTFLSPRLHHNPLILTSIPNPRVTTPPSRPKHHHDPIMTIAVGQPAPDFTKPDTDGTSITLSSFQPSRNVVLYFSNGSGPGCTAQSCSFRDASEDFAKLDAQIIAVSAQRNSSGFKQTNRLPFPVISDSDRSLQRMYGVPATLGLIPGRVTFVIDKGGVVREVINSQFDTAKHISTAAETLKTIENGK